MSAIADLVAHLISTGIPPEALARAVDLAQLHAKESAEIHRNSAGNPPDRVTEKRRAYDRERKRKPANVHIEASPPVSDSQIKKEEIVARGRGIRLPANWEPTDLGFATKAVGVKRADDELEKFRDYWRARAGPGGVKLDWDATWRNWIRNAGQNGKSNGHGKRTIMEACDDLIDRVRAFDEPAPSSLRDGTRENAPRLLPKG